MAFVWIRFESPQFLVGAGLIALLCVGVYFARKLALPRGCVILGAIGILAACIAGGRPNLQIPREPDIAVMVDLSPSSRGAMFRDPTFLANRLHELLGNRPYHLLTFADVNYAAGSNLDLREIPADQTRFVPPPADAILLFSDCRFDLPNASPSVFIAADAGLENVGDAVVNNLEIRNGKLVATITNSGPPRQAIFQGVTGSAIADVPTGQFVIERDLDPHAISASVRLTPGDSWPENDSQETPISPPFSSESWWVGSGAPAGWNAMSADQLPTDPSRYLAPAIIALNNIDARNLESAQIDRLMQYVNDFGGSLLILGGNSGPLEPLSPLSNFPPQPAMQWIILVDSSGSMAQENHWESATSAAVRLLASLPPLDVVSIGQFSDVIRWWSQGKNALETAKLQLPPLDAVPHGPTNLQATLSDVANSPDSSLPTQLLIFSDCDAELKDTDQLLQSFKTHQIHLHILALGNGSALAALKQIAEASGGNVLEQDDPMRWVDSARQLAQAAMLDPVVNSPIAVRFENQAKSLGTISAPIWLHAWAKQDAQIWANGDESDSQTLGADWNSGGGNVAATAFEPDSQIAGKLADLIRRKPRDPRFTVDFQNGSELSFIVQGQTGDQPMNNLPIGLRMQAEGFTSISQLQQTAPGRYEIHLPSPRQYSIATILNGNSILDQFCIAGRYAEEFEQLGNDHNAMNRLVLQTGGKIISSTDVGPLSISSPPRDFSLTPFLSIASAIFLAAALISWRKV